MIRAAVFDLDGTLLDTVPDIGAALNRALAACGLPTHPIDRVKGFVGNGIRKAVTRAVPDGNDTETVDRVLAAYLEDYALRCAEETAYFPGVQEMLRELTDRGMPLAVLSNKTERDVLTIVKHYFPDIPFRCVLGQVDDRPLKPDGAAAKPVLEALGVPAGEVAYVGDTGSDMTFAIAAGMVPVAAPWGYRSRETLIECGAKIIAEDGFDLLRILTEN